MSPYRPVTQFLRPEHLAPLRSLSLRARHIVDGVLAGFHQSPFHGFSAEFLEYQSYRTGESTRYIDWRKYAKTDRAVVKLFRDETNLQARIFLDNSASMGYQGLGMWSKFEYARTLAASLSWILIRQRDAVGLALFNTHLTQPVPPRSSNLHLKYLLNLLENAECSSTTNAAKTIHGIAHSIRKRGLCILISDLLDDPESIRTGLQLLRFRRQECMVIRILDPAEISIPFDNTHLIMRDMETEKELHLNATIANQHHRTGFALHSTSLETICREQGVEYSTIQTNEPFAKALIRVLEKRRRLF